VKLDNPLVVHWEYASEEQLAKRNQTRSTHCVFVAGKS
jgi:hypothetical protein